MNIGNDDNRKLRVLSGINDVPRITIIIPIVIFYIFSVIVSNCARSTEVIMIGENELPISTFSGVFSAFGNICIIVMVLLYKRLGYIVSLVAVLAQAPKIIMGIITMQSLAAIPGLFMSFATIITITIIYYNQKRLEREQDRQQTLFTQTATALVNAIDAKDKYTHGHSTRVAEYSRKIAETSGKSEKECDMIYYAALLHDVGKIGTPQNIITKEGKLTPEEYEIVKQHPTLGAQILENISEFPFLSVGAHYHHERFDGKGYPEGLKGENIPEIARIISVADAYDAMTSVRSYRDPIPQQKVREELVMCMGTQFDPDFARRMIHLIDVDTQYMMKENFDQGGLSENKDLAINEYKSVITEGLLIDRNMTKVHLAVDPYDKSSDKLPGVAMILFDSLDGCAHKDRKEITEMMYFEYAEIWIDGRTETRGARRIRTKSSNLISKDIQRDNEYLIEAVRIRDHALVRIIGKTQSTDIIVALPDSSRFMYVGITGEHCRISELKIVKSEEESPLDYIPRIADEISYIHGPSGDIPNIQIDGYRTSHSEGVLVKDGLELSFHARSLPTARLIWHCPFIDLFSSDDGSVNGKNYTDLAFMRLDGEFWECDPNCYTESSLVKTESFESWDSWKENNMAGFDAVVRFSVEKNSITMITENCGISLKNKLILNNHEKKIYAAVTGDQVAITNIRIHYK